MASVEISQKLRPLKFAFVIKPNDFLSLDAVVSLNTFLWGGRYNPIFPLYKKTPSIFREAHHLPKASEVMEGNMRFYEPDFSQAPEGGTPSFVVRALRDTDGANLDRIQMVKGWMDSSAKTHEKVFDIALSDNRQAGPDGKVPPVGDTVDVANASYTNTIGDALMFAHWTDPDFDAKEHAFYYVRVIEIPTPRWTAFDAKVFGIDMPDEVPMNLQERAYTSPIWYSPAS